MAGREVLEGVEAEGQHDEEEIPDDEGGDEDPVAPLHLEALAAAEQDQQGEQVACGEPSVVSSLQQGSCAQCAVHTAGSLQ